MSGQHDPPGPDQRCCCGDAAVYLLGLLDERQSREFLEHARSCTLCSDDLTALAPAVDSLPSTVAQLSVPEHAKQRVMAVVRSEASQATSSSHRPALQPVGARLGHVRWRPALALAGAGLLAAGIAIGNLSKPFGGGTAPVGGGKAQVVSAAVAFPGASATLHQSAGHTWLAVSNMPEPSTGHVYEVWVKRSASAVPQPTTSLFTPTTSGSATVYVPVGLGASTVMVTQEPVGGSSLPTGPVIIVAHLV